MSKVETFFRHCPGCGRRFEIRVENKTLVRADHTVSTLPAGESQGSFAAYRPLLVGQNEPIVTDTEEFQYTYKCRHCGHEWSEKREEERVER